MRRQLLPALGMLLVFTVLTGLAYPLVVTGVGQGLLPHQADGSLVHDASGHVVGSRLIGQPFAGVDSFHPRPAAGGYVAGAKGGGTSSYGSNEGPTSERFLLGEDDPSTSDVDESTTTGVDDRIRAYREENGLADDALVPVDAVTASASGLDPHISVANAELQAARVAEARDLPIDAVLRLVDQHTDDRDLGFLGEPGVNVLELNLSLPLGQGG